MANWYDNIFSRSFGGTNEDYVVDPFISGFGYVYFVLPTAVFGSSNATQAEYILSASCRQLTLNDVTLDSVADEVQGGIKANYPTKLTLPDTLQAQFLADMNGDVVRVLGQWVNAIRDMRYGAANLVDKSYSKKNYSSIIYYIVTKPDGLTPIDGFAFTGCFPKKFPLEQYSFEIATNDKKLISVDFTVDYIYTLRELVAGEGESSGIKAAFEQKIKSKIEQIKNNIQKTFRSASNLK